MKILSAKKIGAKKDSTETVLRQHSVSSPDNLYKKLSSSDDGLTAHQASEKIEENGPNIITIANKDTTLRRLLRAVVNPFNMVLIAVAIITFFTDVVFAAEPDYLTFTIILGLVLAASLVSFIQGEKSNRAAEKLSKMIVNTASVRRDGEFSEILMEEIVVGDIIKLAAGDMIPADVRFLTTKDLFIAQAALTGESNPVEKFSDPIDAQNSATTDLPNIGFMGSNVISGTATAVVVATGNDTYFGSMAKSLSNKTPKNNFEKGVDSISKLLIRFMLIMIPIIIVINVLTNVGLVNSILFAIAIAVGLTPEMLPVIFTTTLATGAVKMSKQKVIVKSVGSIQAFGEMDILCTDKTGTLTEDKVVLEKYLNIHDNEDEAVLRQAYLNSHFGTSLKNMIDQAIMARGSAEKLDDFAGEYQIVDEIPYDFSRRRISVVLAHQNHDTHMVTKGSFKEVIAVCEHVRYGDKVRTFDQKTRAAAEAVYKKYTSQGIRILAVAEKETNFSADKSYSVADESDMTFVGFIGFLDPPKESAKKAVKALKTHGVRNIVLTGDSEGVAVIVCQKVGIDAAVTLSGTEVENMTDAELKAEVEICSLFYKLSPSQKERVVKTLQGNGHTVGYLGDGINDALPLKQSDVGISVDNAVDIAKETANIILLKKDLLVLEHGVILGRETFGNIIKYIKMATSGNFGNMFSVVIASMFLPFLPMLPLHILAQNLLCDLSQLGIPFDNVDKDFIRKPKKWDTKDIKRFMYILGPISSIFDILCFIILFFIIKANTTELAPIFQCGWFVFGVVSQVLIIHIIRTAKKSFVQSIASKPLMLSTLVVAVLVLVIGFTGVGAALDMMRLPLTFAAWLLLLLVGYALTIETTKRIYIKKFGEWL